MSNTTQIINIFQLDKSDPTNGILQSVLECTDNPFKLTSKCHEALSVYKSIKTNKFDLIIITYEMPLITGDRVINLIRKKGIIAPIIAVSNNADFKVKELMLNAGADFFISEHNEQKYIIETLLKPFKDANFRRSSLYTLNK